MGLGDSLGDSTQELEASPRGLATAGLGVGGGGHLPLGRLSPNREHPSTFSKNTLSLRRRQGGHDGRKFRSEKSPGALVGSCARSNWFHQVSEMIADAGAKPSPRQGRQTRSQDTSAPGPYPDPRAAGIGEGGARCELTGPPGGALCQTQTASGAGAGLAGDEGDTFGEEVRSRGPRGGTGESRGGGWRRVAQVPEVKQIKTF